MKSHPSFEVAGVDGCRGGWAVARVAGRTGPGGELELPLAIDSIGVSPHFADVLLRTYNCLLVCVDIPMGLAESLPRRECDVEARRLLGRRACTVFAPPVRACLRAKSYEEGRSINFRQTGKKLTLQSFFIMDKIRQVDAVMTSAMQSRVREIHPEVTFCVLNGGMPAEHNKKTPAGRDERIALLSTIFPDAREKTEALRRPRQIEPDDVLDALAAAWTAAKAAVGQATTLPEQPPRDSKGLRMEILTPIP
jgi:predicted RNase H-like nuclease